MLKNKKIIRVIGINLFIILFMPILIVANAMENPEIVGESAIVMDIDTGEVIYSKNAEVIRPMASTTKLMTALLFAENKNKEDMIAFSENILKVKESSLNNYTKIKSGDTMSAEDVMEAVLVLSANDASYLMAESINGNIQDFIGMMNERVTKLGLKNTTYYNPCGLEINELDPENKNINETTAYDLAIIAKEAYKNPWVKEIVTKKESSTIQINDYKLVLESNTTNKVIGTNGNLGGKTGTEDLAGKCFVGYYSKNGRNLVTVVLKSEVGTNGMTVFEDTEKIADYASSAEKVPYKSKDEEIFNLNLEYKPYKYFGKSKTITVPVKLSEDIKFYKNDLNEKNISIQYKGSNKGWDIAKNNEIEVEVTKFNTVEKVKGEVQVSRWILVKSCISTYILHFGLLILVLAITLFIVRTYNINRRRKRKFNKNKPIKW